MAVMRRIYDFAGAACPDLSHTQQVHASSVKKGKGLELLPEVRDLCEQLQTRLDAQYELQSRTPVIAPARAEAGVPQLQPASLQVGGVRSFAE
jgi:hypothetical protein